MTIQKTTFNATQQARIIKKEKLNSLEKMGLIFAGGILGPTLLGVNEVMHPGSIKKVAKKAYEGIKNIF
ncbi:MAG TPA: hypothetical protein PLG15_04385 [Candidatus Gastranaerophilaceae bacterium]|mgnify:CR=1 FL=1|nr:hypothetical protein [Candidatus Gastranaerophilaceae bacterium]HPT41605.1 hypothetical protein [Candidatus Gastranaerophilaceae bacterium]